MPVNRKQFTSEYQPKEKWTEEIALKLGKELIEWLKEIDDTGQDKGNIFYEEFIVLEKDLYPEIIAYLSGKYPSFLNLIGKAKKIQEIKLVKYGVGDRLNATMTKFVLMNCHNFVEKANNNNVNENINFDSKDQDEIKAYTLERKG